MDEDKIREMLSRARFRPSPTETELFVQKVMSALPIERASSLPRLGQRWFAPAMAFSFAALVISVFPVYQSLEDDSTSLLLADRGSAAPAEPRNADEALEFVLGDR